MKGSNKLFILGLDSAAPQLVFDKYRNSLKNIRYVMEAGVYGKLTSTCPPVTVPAWMSMFSGKDPGELGFYGFIDRKSYEYMDDQLINSNSVKDKLVWDYLAAENYKTVVIGVPQTYPPRSINGIMVSSFLTPDKDFPYTYPDDIKIELDRIAEGDYIIDVENFKTKDKKMLLDQILSMTKRRFMVIEDFLINKDWDLFVAVEMGVDRIQHAFWKYCFSNMKNSDIPNECIKDYYGYIDEWIGRLLEIIDGKSDMMILSDHGAKENHGTFYINKWLIRNGYLSLKKNKNIETDSMENIIDWKKTSAWAEGGYYGKIYFNIKGRENEGKIKLKDIDSFRNGLVEKLNEVDIGLQKNIQNNIFIPQKTYRKTKNIPPDLIVYCGDLDYRISGRLEEEKNIEIENSIVDGANHSREGIFIGYSKGGKKSNVQNCFSIQDITPTILNRFKIKNIPDFSGKMIDF